MPQVRHLEHIGLALEHLTLARKQPSQDARRRGWRCLEAVAMAVIGCRSRDVETVAVVDEGEGGMKVEVELEWDGRSEKTGLDEEILLLAPACLGGLKKQKVG